MKKGKKLVGDDLQLDTMDIQNLNRPLLKKKYQRFKLK